MGKSRWRAVSGALVAVGALLAVSPTAVEAQIGEYGTADLVIMPGVAAPGGTVTVTPEEGRPCPAGEELQLSWELWDVDGSIGGGDLPPGDLTIEVIDSGTSDVNEDGTWELELTVPTEVDSYGVSASCYTAEGAHRGPVYLLTWFEVVEPGTPPTGPPTTWPSIPAPPPPSGATGQVAPPARAVVGQPNFTG